MRSFSVGRKFKSKMFRDYSNLPNGNAVCDVVPMEIITEYFEKKAEEKRKAILKQKQDEEAALAVLRNKRDVRSRFIVF